MKPDGSDRINLTKSPGAERSFAWSPDGARIASLEWAKDGENAWPAGFTLVVVNADGSGRAELTQIIAWPGAPPTWSPDGAQIAYTTLRDGPPRRQPDPDGATDLYTIRIDGSGLTQLASNQGETSFVFGWTR